MKVGNVCVCISGWVGGYSGLKATASASVWCTNNCAPFSRVSLHFLPWTLSLRLRSAYLIMWCRNSFVYVTEKPNWYSQEVEEVGIMTEFNHEHGHLNEGIYPGHAYVGMDVLLTSVSSCLMLLLVKWLLTTRSFFFFFFLLLICCLNLNATLLPDAEKERGKQTKERKQTVFFLFLYNYC